MKELEGAPSSAAKPATTENERVPPGESWADQIAKGRPTAKSPWSAQERAGASAEGPNRKGWCTKKRCLFISMIVFAVLATGIGLGVSLGLKSDTSTSTAKVGTGATPFVTGSTPTGSSSPRSNFAVSLTALHGRGTVKTTLRDFTLKNDVTPPPTMPASTTRDETAADKRADENLIGSWTTGTRARNEVASTEQMENVTELPTTHASKTVSSLSTEMSTMKQDLADAGTNPQANDVLTSSQETENVSTGDWTSSRRVTMVSTASIVTAEDVTMPDQVSSNNADYSTTALMDLENATELMGPGNDVSTPPSVTAVESRGTTTVQIGFANSTDTELASSTDSSNRTETDLHNATEVWSSGPAVSTQSPVSELADNTSTTALDRAMKTAGSTAAGLVDSMANVTGATFDDSGSAMGDTSAAFGNAGVTQPVDSTRTNVTDMAALTLLNTSSSSFDKLTVQSTTVEPVTTDMPTTTVQHTTSSGVSTTLSTTAVMPTNATKITSPVMPKTTVNPHPTTAFETDLHNSGTTGLRNLTSTVQSTTGERVTTEKVPPRTGSVTSTAVTTRDVLHTTDSKMTSRVMPAMPATTPSLAPAQPPTAGKSERPMFLLVNRIM